MTESSDKKSLKRARVCTYFIKAAKDIILAEGVESVSVRKVADRAGYAFSTLYKHYNDLDALLQDVKASMIGDIFVYMKDALSAGVPGLDDIKKTNRLYASYYLEHPHVFRFFYSYRLNPSPAQAAELPDFSRYWHMTYRGFVGSGTLREEDIPVLSKAIIYILHGIIAMYFAGYGLSEEALFDELDQICDFMLGGKTK